MTDTKGILQTLAKDFPNAKSELNFHSPYQLIVAVILSAQCTDKRVNTVTPLLFQVAPTPQALAQLPLEQIEQIIRPCGFYHSKATYLKDMARDLVDRFDGNVPNNLDDLQTLKGVGRKTANVVFAVAFGGQAIAVDTHVFRVSNRLGIVTAKNVLETEKQLMQAIPKEEWADSHHYILLHGRYVCKAQNPQCDVCSVQSYCKFYRQKNGEKALQEAQKCLHCKNANCQSHCPLGNDISQITKLVRQNKWADALQLIDHPFGEICGYICPHQNQCLGNCILQNKGKGVDFPQVERVLFAQNKFDWQVVGDKLCGKKIAVVGGGVAGITFAYKTYRQGAQVTIYERNELLSTLKLIPSYRLPKGAISRIVDSIPKDVTVVYQQVDKQTLTEMASNFDYVYIATGAMQSYSLGVDGDNYAITHTQCLQEQLKGKVVVVGGGNTAMDCATRAKKLGCDVTVAYRRTQKDMPAFSTEIALAKKLGVQFLFNVAPTKLQKTGKKLQLTLAKTVSQGRSSLEITSDTLDVTCDVVVSAVGSTCEKYLFDGQKPTFGEVGQIAPKTFVGGDVVSAGLVVQAVKQATLTADFILKRW